MLLSSQNHVNQVRRLIRVTIPALVVCVLSCSRQRDNELESRPAKKVSGRDATLAVVGRPFPIGFSTLSDPTWIPKDDSLSETFAEIRRFSSFRAYHDSGFFDPAQTISDSRLIGRSVWNTDWMLIIPGGTFLFDPNQGLDTFVNSVSDIKIFFQTYAYSGN